MSSKKARSKCAGTNHHNAFAPFLRAFSKEPTPSLDSSSPAQRDAPQACPVESNPLFKPPVTCASRYSMTPNPQLPERCYSTGAERSYFANLALALLPGLFNGVLALFV